MNSNNPQCYSALYIGSGVWNSDITIKNSKNYGNLTASYVGLVLGNPYAYRVTSKLSLDNVENLGTITFFTSGSAIGGAMTFDSTKGVVKMGASEYSIKVNNFTSGAVISSKDTSMSLAVIDGKLSYTPAQNSAIVNYKVVAVAYANWSLGEAGGTHVLPVNIEISELSNWNNNIKFMDKTTYSQQFGKTIDNWENYEGITGVKISKDIENKIFVFDFDNASNGFDYTLNASATISIAGYDLQGALIALSSCK